MGELIACLEKATTVTKPMTSAECCTQGGGLHFEAYYVA